MRRNWWVWSAVSVALLGAGVQPASADGGNLDRSFGVSGYVSTRLGAHEAPGVRVQSLASQADGKLVVGGSVDGHPLAARFNADGSPDASFGSGGTVRMAAVSDFTGTSVALDSNGRVLVAGIFGDFASAGVAAFTPGGSADLSFGQGGLARVAGFGAQAMAVQPDNAVVLVGNDTVTGKLARLTATGGLDATFGSAGVATTGGMSSLRYVVLDGGKIVVAGQDGITAALERFTSTGAPDGSFGSAGHVSADFGAASTSMGGLGQQADGYVVAVFDGLRTHVEKFTKTGAVVPATDFGFGENSLWSVFPSSLTVGADGSIVVAGNDSPASQTGAQSAVVGRFDNRGAINSDWGCWGKSHFNWDSALNDATAAVLLGGTVVAAGWTAASETGDRALVLARLEPFTAYFPGRSGYRLLSASGDTEVFGSEPACETGTVVRSVAPFVGVTDFPRGAYLAASDGAVFAMPSAQFYGSMGGRPLNSPIVGIATYGDGQGGYYLVAADGGVFAFGGEPFFGSMGGKHLNAPIVDMAVTPDGQGYWLVAADGGVFAFGSARFYGSMGGKHLNAPIVGMAPAPDGGYWLVAADGGVFAFGHVHFFGSMGGKPLNAPVVAIAAPRYAEGYWLLARDGGVFAYGGAPFYGSMGGRPGRGPWIAMGACRAAPGC